MSLENEERHSPDKFSEVNEETQKKLRISYTRDFLLSLSDLDVCKKLPSGFDQSILSGFLEASQDRQRTSGGLSLNSFRRNEYGSSPPTRGDSSSYSWAIHGKWESRSSGRSDRDSDSLSDWDSDSGRQYGNQPRRPWQVPEHDGLLGSGSFPRPSGYASGASVPKARPNENCQLSRSNEPYQPPRPFKAVPHSRRETNDSYNHETFGSSEITSEDRAEEERKRRASFELMRKEQHKSFQEKQKSNLDTNKDDFDISTLMEESKDDKRSVKRSSESYELVRPVASDNDLEKSSAPSQIPASRPLVPPGFTSTILDRAKSLNHSHAAEAGTLESEDNPLLGKRNTFANLTSDDQEDKQLAEEINLWNQQHESVSSHASINSQSGKGLGLSSLFNASDKKVGSSSILHDKTNTTQVFEASNSSEVIELNVENINRPSVLGDSNQGHPTSILDKLFGSAFTLNVADSSVFEHHDNEVDEVQSPQISQSSKFAHWFNEEERKLSNDQSSGRSNDLLSLLVGAEKDESRVFGNKNEQSLPNFPFQNSEIADKLLTSDVISASVGSFGKLLKDNKTEPVSAVLTCEDLEQSILSEISDNNSVSQPPVQSWIDPDGKTEQPKANTDNLASRHLLSLLQKGTTAKDVESSSNLDTLSSDNIHDIEANIATALHNTREAKDEKISDSAKSLTLETLFGSAFMKELQSVGAPVSIQRGPAGPVKVNVSDTHGFPVHVAENRLPFSKEIGFGSAAYESGILTEIKRKQNTFDKIEEQWLSFDDAQAEINASHLRANFGSKVGGFDAPGDVRLPEEDSLISASDPLSIENFMLPGSVVKSELLSSSNVPVDYAEKLATFNSAFREERSVRGGQEPPFLRGAYDMRESSNPYQNLNIQPSFPQLHPPQLNNNMGPLFHHLDSRPVNINSQMKYMTPEAVAHHDPAPNHQIPMNILRPSFHHPGSGVSGFDQPIHHPMMQQVHMPGIFPPNLLQGLPRGPSLPPHPNRSAPMPAHSNYASLGLPQPAPDIVGGHNHPEAFQRLIDMELRSNLKQQIHPFASGGQSHGMYGHELDMGLGFR